MAGMTVDVPFDGDEVPALETPDDEVSDAHESDAEVPETEEQEPVPVKNSFFQQAFAVVEKMREFCSEDEYNEIVNAVIEDFSLKQARTFKGKLEALEQKCKKLADEFDTAVKIEQANFEQARDEAQKKWDTLNAVGKGGVYKKKVQYQMAMEELLEEPKSEPVSSAASSSSNSSANDHEFAYVLPAKEVKKAKAQAKALEKKEFMKRKTVLHGYNHKYACSQDWYFSQLPDCEEEAYNNLPCGLYLRHLTQEYKGDVTKHYYKGALVFESNEKKLVASAYLMGMNKFNGDNTNAAFCWHGNKCNNRDKCTFMHTDSNEAQTPSAMNPLVYSFVDCDTGDVCLSRHNNEKIGYLNHNAANVQLVNAALTYAINRQIDEYKP